MSANSTRDLIPGLGAAIRARRDHLGLTLDDVATAIGSGPAAVSKVELEQRAPSARLLLAIAEALETGVDALVADARARTAEEKSP